METLLARANALMPRLVELRRALHAIPELGFELPQTRALVVKTLTELGLSCTECGGGVIATIGDASKGATVLLRADMDALPMAEQSGLPFAAKGERCHACGHDLHTTMLLGAAMLLRSMSDRMAGAVKLMFQPAEEVAQGAKAMLDEGVLNAPNVNAAIGIHVAPNQPVGRLNCTCGAKTASFDHFAVTFIGKGGHGAQPQNTVDPINAAVHAYTMLEALIARECTPTEPTVLTVGSFHAGAAGNVIPESASMEGTCRAASADGRNRLKRRLTEICSGVATTLGAAAKIEWRAEVPSLYNDPQMALQLCKALQNVGLKADAETEYLSASEDFALIAERVPTLYLTIGTGWAQEGRTVGNHHPAVRYDEEALPQGAAALAVCAVEQLAFCNG